MPSQDQVDRVANLSDAQADIFTDVSTLHLPQNTMSVFVRDSRPDPRALSRACSS